MHAVEEEEHRHVDDEGGGDEDHGHLGVGDEADGVDEDAEDID